MIDSQKCRFDFHLVEGGLEFATSVCGQEKRRLAMNFINGLLNADHGGSHSVSNNPEEHFIVSIEQFEAIQKFIKQKS